MAWNIEVQTTSIGNCFLYLKIRSQGKMTFDQVGEEESIYGLKKIIFNLLYKLEMDVM